MKEEKRISSDAQTSTGDQKRQASADAEPAEKAGSFSGEPPKQPPPKEAFSVSGGSTKKD